MRKILLLAALLLTSLLPPLVQAATGCSGSWSWSQTGADCSFVCDGTTISVWGDAIGPGQTSIAVVAECIVGYFQGVAVVAASVSCSDSQHVHSTCSGSMPYLGGSLNLVGRCGAAGAVFGSFSCSSS